MRELRLTKEVGRCKPLNYPRYDFCKFYRLRRMGKKKSEKVKFHFAKEGKK